MNKQEWIDCGVWVTMGANVVGLLMLAGLAALHVASDMKARAVESMESPHVQQVVTSPWFQSVEKSQVFQDAVAIGRMIP